MTSSSVVSTTPFSRSTSAAALMIRLRVASPFAVSCLSTTSSIFELSSPEYRRRTHRDNPGSAGTAASESLHGCRVAHVGAVLVPDGVYCFLPAEPGAGLGHFAEPVWACCLADLAG